MDSATLKTDIEKQMCESRIANAEMLLECSLAGDNVYPETAHFPLLDAVSRLGHSNKCYFLGYYSSDYRIYSTDVEICGSSDYPPKSVDHPPRCSMSSWMMPGKSYHTESNIDHTEFASPDLNRAKPWVSSSYSIVIL